MGAEIKLGGELDKRKGGGKDKSLMKVKRYKNSTTSSISGS